MTLAKISFGVFLPFYAFGSQIIASSMYDRIRDIALESERLGYDSVWLDDHLMFGRTPILECWTTLSALSVSTRRVRLGTMVTSNAFRNPALTAKMAATVDVISGGRLEFGLGAGIQEDEHAAYGFSFPKTSTRVDRLKEAIEVMQLLWTREEATYSGTHYRLAKAVCKPRPIQKPHPPITIGGIGEKHLLRVTARYADRFDFSYLPTMETFKHKLEVLKKHCTSIGRDFEEIEKSCWPEGQIILSEDRASLEEKIQQIKPEGVSRRDFARSHFLGTPDEFAAKLKPYLDLGVTHFMLYFADLPNLGSLRLFSETIRSKIGC